MAYSYSEVIDFVEQEDVKFIRLAFCDIYGNQKNISIMPEELFRAFTDGISFDASVITGFESSWSSDLFLFPDPSTLSVLPWRPAQGRVIRMFCDIKYPDGRDFELNCRHVLKKAVADAKEKGVLVNFGSEFKFYLFKTDENRLPTGEPFDRAGYMDIAPEDRGENIRREICFTLMDMGIKPESSHHEAGPGQNEIDFRYSDALSAADNAVTFKMVVKTIATRDGLYADMSPKPVPGESGNGMHINMSVNSAGDDKTESFMAGIMEHIEEMTAFLNPCEDSYKRLGENNAPEYIMWSRSNNAPLLRVPAAKGDHRRIELRSPDPMANPYIAYSLLIYAGLDGIERGLKPQPPEDGYVTELREKKLKKLPGSLKEAVKAAKDSEFINSVLPEKLVQAYLR